MSARIKPEYITAEEYLALERKAEFKSEYYNGVIYQMAGARRPHNRIVSSLVSRLDEQLREPDCNVYANDLRVCVNPQTGLYTYPDVIVTCGEERFLDKEFDTLLNPVVIFEVLSDSTEKYDKGKKFDLYDGIESLREYVLVASDRVRIDHYTRHADGNWLLKIRRKLDDTIKLEAIECELRVTDIYLKVKVREGFDSLKDDAETSEIDE